MSSLKMLDYRLVYAGTDSARKKVVHFIDTSAYLNVYRSSENPIINKSVKKELLCENIIPHISSGRLIFEDYSLDITSNISQVNKIYIGNKDMLIILPRGYDGAFVYYYFCRV